MNNKLGGGLNYLFMSTLLKDMMSKFSFIPASLGFGCLD